MKIIKLLTRNTKRLLRLQSIIFFQKTINSNACVQKNDIVEIDAAQFRSSSLEMPGFPWSEAKNIQGRFSNGHKLYALSLNGNAVSFGWVSLQQSFDVGELRGKCIVGTNAIWIWDCVTLPEHRGRGYYTRLLQSLLCLYPGSRYIIFSRSDNDFSVRGILRAGFHSWACITVWRLGYWMKIINKDFGDIRFDPRI
jgi:GNAT superfamily N-acetyltransferase